MNEWRLSVLHIVFQVIELASGSQDMHLTQMPLVIGCSMVNKQRGVCHLCGTNSWGCFSGGSGTPWHGLLASKGQGVMTASGWGEKGLPAQCLPWNKKPSKTQSIRLQCDMHVLKNHCTLQSHAVKINGLVRHDTCTSSGSP